MPALRVASQPAQDSSGTRGVGLLRDLSAGVALLAAGAKPAVVYVTIAKNGSLGEGAAKSDGEEGLPPELQDFLHRFFVAPPGADVPGDRLRQMPPRIHGVGSGFITDLEHGYIVTNNHVVEGADEISVRLASGVTSAAVVVGRDRNTDLAVVRLNDKAINKAGLGVLAFANSDKVVVGDFALAVGAPFGLESSLSFGVVSATGRGTLGITQLGDFLQTDAAINPGNSGGPLIDASGQVIGVNTVIATQTGTYAGVGFAIPSNLARLVVERLIAKGRVDRGYLGLSLQAVSPELRQGLDIPSNVAGAIVANVQAGSPAATSGLQAGDVVTAVDGHPLKSEMDLVNSVGMMEPGQKIEVSYFRAGKQHTASIRLGKWPEAGPPSGLAEEHPQAQKGELGLGLAPVSPELRKRFGFSAEKGAVVINVASGSQADEAGIEVGDVILSVNQHRVATPLDVKRLAGSNAKLIARMERHGTYFFTTLEKRAQRFQGTSH